MVLGKVETLVYRDAQIMIKHNKTSPSTVLKVHTLVERCNDLITWSTATS